MVHSVERLIQDTGYFAILILTLAIVKTYLTHDGRFSDRLSRGERRRKLETWGQKAIEIVQLCRCLDFFNLLF